LGKKGLSAHRRGWKKDAREARGFSQAGNPTIARAPHAPATNRSQQPKKGGC